MGNVKSISFNQAIKLAKDNLLSEERERLSILFDAKVTIKAEGKYYHPSVTMFGIKFTGQQELTTPKNTYGYAFSNCKYKNLNCNFDEEELSNILKSENAKELLSQLKKVITALNKVANNEQTQ